MIRTKLIPICILLIITPLLSFGQKIKVQAKFKQYDFSYFNQSINDQSIELSQGQKTLQFQSNDWQISHFKKSSADKNLIDYQTEFLLLNGSQSQIGLGIEFVISDWSAKNYLLLPAAAYNGNRFEAKSIPYAPLLYKKSDISKDVPTFISDVPRLNLFPGLSQIQERSGALSIPMIAWHDSARAKAYFIVAPPHSKLGDWGIHISENRDRSQAVLCFMASVVRQQYQYKIANNRANATDRAPDFKAKESLSIDLKFYELDAKSLADFYLHFFQIRNAYHKQYSPDQVIDPLPLSKAYDLIEKKYNQTNWNPEYHFYAVDAMINNQRWQPGWVGGFITSFALSFAGDDTTRKRLAAQDKIFRPLTQTDIGLFYDEFRVSTGWQNQAARFSYNKPWSLVRGSGDALYYALRLELERPGYQTSPSNLAKLKKCADTFIGIWEKNKQLGQFVNLLTGQIEVGNSSSGAIVPAALVLASRLFNQPDYLKTAEQIGTYYYNNFVAKGYTTGGPGEALQNPDSESGFGMIESYTLLYEQTGQTKWAVYGSQAAHLFSSWVMAYNYQFPATSSFGQLNIRSRGAVLANTQNKHFSPHICTHSGLSLLKLYRQTGDSKFAQLLENITTGATQYVSRDNRPISYQPSGWVDERVNTTDWLEAIGEIACISTWAEIAVMLTAVEVPSLYIDLDKKQQFCFDHLQVISVKYNKKSVVLKLKNHTNYAATYSICTDRPSKNRVFKPNYTKVNVAAGASADLEIKI